MPKAFLKQLSLFSVILLLILLIPGSLSYARDNQPPAKTRLARFGFLENFAWEVNSKDAKLAVKVWMQKVADKRSTGIEIDGLSFSDLPQMVKAIKTKSIDIFAIGSLDYLKLKDQLPIEPAFMGIRGDNPAEEFVLLVNKDNGIKNLRALKNKKLIIVVGDRGKVPLLWLNTLHLKAGLAESDAFFGEIKAVNKASRAVLPVFFGQADAALVNSISFKTIAELNPQVGKKLKVLFSSPHLLPNFLCFRKDFDSEAKEIIRVNIIKLNDDIEGKQALTIFKPDDIVLFKPAFLDNVISLLKEYNSLKKKRCKDEAA